MKTLPIVGLENEVKENARERSLKDRRTGVSRREGEDGPHHGPRREEKRASSTGMASWSVDFPDFLLF